MCDAVEVALIEQTKVRGERRARKGRKEAMRQLRKLRRERSEGTPNAATGCHHGTKTSHTGSTSHGSTADTVASAATALGPTSSWTDGSIVVGEAYVRPLASNFISSAQSKHWKREKDAEYHLSRLLDEDCVLRERVPIWEALEDQPQAFDLCSDRNAWRKKSIDPDQNLVPHGDEYAFRDLKLLANMMSMHSREEIHYKLAVGKPAPTDEDHADCIVIYVNSGDPKRAVGSVVYDAIGQCRVDINFELHGSELSGHFHILSPGDATHTDHQPFQHCPWIWQAIPKSFNVAPSRPIGN